MKGEKRVVWIIGLGGIGIRHFQSLTKSGDAIHFFLTDKNPDLQKDVTEWERDFPFHQFTWISLDSLDIPFEPDLLIVATSSGPRFAILDNLILKGVSPRFVLLEKFLFTDENEYKLYGSSSWASRTYVNTPRRLYETYQVVKSRLANTESPITMNVFGNNWGIGCNSIHFLDVFSFLGDIKEIDGVDDSLAAGWIQSKRLGYIEFTGLITLKANNNQISLQDFTSEGPVWVLVALHTPNWYIEVRESERKVVIRNIKSGEVETFDFKMKYQSELTLSVFEKLMNGQSCNLPSFEHSAYLHLCLLKMYKNHVLKHGWQALNLPIT